MFRHFFALAYWRADKSSNVKKNKEREQRATQSFAIR
jgi:hypothetical protein